MACGKYIFVLLLYGNGGEEEGGGDAAVDVAVLTVGFLLVGGEGGDVGGVGGFDDGVEVEGDGLSGCDFVAHVREVEGGTGGLALDAGHEHADVGIGGDGIDVHDVVGSGFVVQVGEEGEVDMKAVGMDAVGADGRERATGQEEGGVVDVDLSVAVDEVVFVEAREVVGFGESVGMGFLGEAALEDGAEEGGGMLARREEGPLAQLGFGLTVVVFRRQLARVGLAEAGVVYDAADGAGVFDDGGFDFCHSVSLWVYQV